MRGAQFEPLDSSKIRPLVELPEEFVRGILADREKQRHLLNQALLMGEKGIQDQ